MAPSPRPATELRLLSVVAPVYDEAQGLGAFVQEVRQTLEALPRVSAYEIILVDDGSTDGTAEQLDALVRDSGGRVTALHLCRNFGHASAITAGLDHAHGDAVVLMDADLQDDPAVFPEFVEKWFEGYDVAYAVRTSRRESWPVRWGMALFYRLLGWVSDTKIPRSAGTFSLMDRRVVKVLCTLPERNRFLPGLRAWIGFRQASVQVPRRGRYDRRSRVGLRGLWRLSMNAIFSFSYFPLFFFRALGLLTLAGCFALAAFVLYHKCVSGKAVTAWASQMLSILFFGGINLLGIGIIGEYVARIYDELKGRPLYIVDRIVQAVPHFAPTKAGARSGPWRATATASRR
jgi:dolichol-phosphate mannosyltransferase